MKKQLSKGFFFCPLGGVGEIGSNLSLYVLDGKFLLVDIGLGFSGGQIPGVDITIPDISFLNSVKKDIVGAFITHGHEDHIGAIPYLQDEISFPIYTTKFTADIIRSKLENNRLDIREVGLGEKFTVGPFDLEGVPLPHSIPEMQALIIKTEYGTLFHSGDWKFDNTPIVGTKTNYTQLEKIGKEGIDFFICDSTNVFKRGTSGSEKDVVSVLEKIIAEKKRNLIVLTTFSSNIARVASCLKIAKKFNRKVAFVGRSLNRIQSIAQKHGYIKHENVVIHEKEIKNYPKEKLLVIATGCQAEKNAAISKLSNQLLQHINLTKDDVIIFSAKVIPGNEKKIYNLISQFIDKGIEVIGTMHKLVHVSGHPARDELKQMYKLLKPSTVIPAHGELSHLKEHVKFAEECGIKNTYQLKNGEVLQLNKEEINNIAVVKTGHIAVDGNSLINIDSPIFEVREALEQSGIIIVSIVIEKNECTTLKISGPGILDQELDRLLISSLENNLLNYIKKLNRNRRSLEKSVYNFISNFLYNEFGKSPVINIHLLER